MECKKYRKEDINIKGGSRMRSRRRDNKSAKGKRKRKEVEEE